VADRAPEALDASVRAAPEAAEAMAGFTEALRHVERVLALWARVPAAEKLAGTDLAGTLERAAELAELSRRRPPRRRRALTTLGDQDALRAGMLQYRPSAYLLWAAGDHELMADASVALGRGELERAGARLAEAAGAATGDVRASLQYVALIAELSLLEGRPDRARDVLDRALADATAPDAALRRRSCARSLCAPTPSARRWLASEGTPRR
jgi:hypothetical protein